MIQETVLNFDYYTQALLFFKGERQGNKEKWLWECDLLNAATQYDNITSIRFTSPIQNAIIVKTANDTGSEGR